VKWRHVVLPALLAAVALKIANSFLSWYISTLGYYNAVYGSLTSVIVLLMWIYVCANILIVGAALSATLADLSHPPPALYPARKD
jgi:membrane protein